MVVLGGRRPAPYSVDRPSTFDPAIAAMSSYGGSRADANKLADYVNYGSLLIFCIVILSLSLISSWGGGASPITITIHSR